MKPKCHRQVGWLGAALLAMVLGLGGLIGFIHVAVRNVGEMNRLIARDTAPGVVALQGMNTNAARLRSLLRESLSPSADLPALKRQIAKERLDFAENHELWLSLPIDPGESDLMDEAKLRVEQLDELLRRILATTTATPPTAREALRDELEQRASALDDVIMRATRLNADLAHRASVVAERVGRRLLPAAIATEATSLVLAAFALIAAHRAQRVEAALVEQRVLQQKNAELEAFAGRVAHDVLSPLLTVSLAVNAAEMRLSTSGDERVKGMLKRAESSLQRVRRVVSDLLSFARAAATPPPGAATEVAPLLESLVHDLEPIAAAEGVDLRLDNAPPTRVRCSEGILSSIVTNLVQNAIRHTDKDEHRVDVRALDEGADVRFEVEDTGNGVAPEDRERIFDPYVRATDQGTGLGLGLATVKRLTESHGGHVGVCSPCSNGHGALFWVTLPTAA